MNVCVFLGTKGRTTIPLPIRKRLGLRPGDLLSYTLEGDSIILRREQICSKCAAGQAEALDEFFDSLNPEEQDALISWIVQMILKQMGGMLFG